MGEEIQISFFNGTGQDTRVYLGQVKMEGKVDALVLRAPFRNEKRHCTSGGEERQFRGDNGEDFLIKYSNSGAVNE